MTSIIKTNVFLSELQEDLVTFYRSRVNSIPIAPLAPENDQEMSKIYVTPDIRKVKNKQDTRKSNQTGIVSYEEILLCSKDIYIQGDPGIHFARILYSSGVMFSDLNHRK